GGEAPLAAQAFPPAPDDRALVGEARIDDLVLQLGAKRALHRPAILSDPPLPRPFFKTVSSDQPRSARSARRCPIHSAAMTWWTCASTPPWEVAGMRQAQPREPGKASPGSFSVRSVVELKEKPSGEAVGVEGELAGEVGNLAADAGDL